MKKIVSSIIMLAMLVFLMPTFAYAAVEAEISVFVPTGTSLATERIIYNAVEAAGGTASIQQRLSGQDSLQTVIGRNNTVAAGISDYSQIDNSEGLVKIDIPIGKVEYTAYMREDAKISLGSWAAAQGLRVGIPVDSNYVMSHFEEYMLSADNQAGFENLNNGLTDVFITTVYDGATPQAPEGIVVAGVVGIANTYCWYNSSQPQIGQMLREGLQSIKANGILDRIRANKSVQADNPKVIFQLSSYSDEMIWEGQAEQALHETLGKYEEPFSLYVHNMNFRQTNYRQAQYDTTSSFIRSTFMSEYPDVIIAMDNDALAYLQQNYTQMFNGVPVVFCGINGYNDGLVSNFAQYTTGVSEFIDPTETVEFALGSNPNINRIYTIFDETSSASPVKASLMHTLEDKYGQRMEIVSSGNISFNDIISEIKGFDSNTMVLVGTYFSDIDGRFMPESEVAQRLYEEVDLPVYGLMSGYSGYGIVGGRVAYSRTFMAEATKMAIRILNGENVRDIPMIGDAESEALLNTFIVDKTVADRFGIPEGLYKSTAIVLNDDVSIFEEYPVLTTAAIALILVLAVITLFLLKLMRSRRTRNNAIMDAENEKEHSRMKSDFLALMSHEIRTPLNAIIGMDELILREELPERIRKNAMIILHSGRSLLSLINDILDFSKIEAGKMELVLSEYDVGSLIYDTVSMIRVRVSEKPIEVKMDVSPDFPAYLYGDETRVRQVLLNFLTNAAKYTNEGRITLKADFEFDNEEKKSGMAVFTIADTGIGIKKEDIEHLFKAFTQADTKTNRKVEGTGLGLAITKNFVEMMDGDISISSNYGIGSVFTVRLRQEILEYKPLENAWEAFKKRIEDEGKTKDVRFVAPRARILAVDDVQANLMVISGLLSPYKVKVDTVTSGVDAVEAAMQNDYDFIFMDHMMPGMDGVETTAKIRGMSDEQLKNIPIIALTANAITGMKDMFLTNGFNDFMSKPIELDELDKIMRRWIPKEKQLATMEDAKKEQVAEVGLNSIDGIDIQHALLRFGGNVEIYEKILRQFEKSLDESIEELSKLISDGSTEEVRACLHSIKGMSGNVDCTEIYTQSQKLEAAAKEDNLAYVKDNVSLFMEKARAVAASIRKNLA